MMSVRVCFLLLVSALTMAQSSPVPRIKQPRAGGAPNGVSQPDTATRGNMVEGYGKLPLSFEANQGQTDASSVASQASGLKFAPAVQYDSGGWLATSLAVADVNGDGNEDLIVANACPSPPLSGSTCSTHGVLGVLLGNGDGTFRPAVTYDSGGYLPNAVATSDVNGDGKLDILVVNGCGNELPCLSVNSTVAVLLGNGDGTFQTPVVTNSGGYSSASIAVADLNGDGKPDVVLANGCSIANCTEGGGSMSVLLGNGDGTFQTAMTYDFSQIGGLGIAIGDVNQDGKADVVVSNGCSGCSVGVWVLLGNGDGTFQTPVGYPAGAEAENVVLSDLNGDGKLDIVVADTSSDAVGVLLGNGDGTFQPQKTFPSGGNGPFWVAVANVNGDGQPDLVVANCGSACPSAQGLVGVLLGNEAGGFQTAAVFDSGGYVAVDIATSDLNGDGKPDLVVANDCASEPNSGANCSTDGAVGVLINASITATTTSLVSSPDPSNFAQSVTFTATVTALPGFYKGPPPGTVQFLDGTTLLGSSTLNSSGVAALTTSKLLAGTHSVTATYKGDTNFAPSTSPVLSQTVLGAIAKLSASSVTFGSETVGMASAAKSVTLTNKGNIALTIASVGITGTDSADFVASKCPASIAPSGTCVISVTFKPTATGTRTATLSITDSAPSKVQKASLTGAGVSPAITLSPTSLTFPAQVVYTTSAPKVVTLKNAGLGVANIKSIAVTGPFSQKHSCGTAVNPGGGCTISVTFEPKAMGGLTGSLTVTDNASNSPQKVTLTGTGTYVKLAPTSINFGNQPEGSKSLAKQITLTNAGATAVTITSIAITGTDAGDFAQTHTCGTSVASGGSCFIKVTFTPSTTGARTAQVSISDNGGGTPQKVNLTGTGTP